MRYTLLVLLFFPFMLFAQSNYLFDTSKVDANTKLIGWYPQYDKQKTYRDLNFIIEDPEKIKQVLTSLTLGKKGKNISDDPDFNLSIVQGIDEVKLWSVNPTLNSIMSNGETYEFDVAKLKGLAMIYPFDYKFDKISFKTKKEYDDYLTKQKKVESFLFSYAPSFVYEGSFDVEFPRNKTFSSPMAISEYLKPLIEKITAKGTYGIGYELNHKNLSDQTQFTITIESNKELFEKLPLGPLKKSSWQPMINNGWLFYQIK